MIYPFYTNLRSFNIQHLIFNSLATTNKIIQRTLKNLKHTPTNQHKTKNHQPPVGTKKKPKPPEPKPQSPSTTLHKAFPSDLLRTIGVPGEHVGKWGVGNGPKRVASVGKFNRTRPALSACTCLVQWFRGNRTIQLRRRCCPVTVAHYRFNQTWSRHWFATIIIKLCWGEVVCAGGLWRVEVFGGGWVFLLVLLENIYSVQNYVFY